MSSIDYNIKVHNKIADQYDKLHGEIFNNYEQARLKSSLSKGLNFIETSSQNKLVVDLGCGTGNITDHLYSLGVKVISADVSESFLKIIEFKYPKNVSTKILNGYDLSNFNDKSVDMIAIYSVLHHIPDYIKILEECIRVIKKGGVLYIDHEVPEYYYQNLIKYKKFYKLVSKFNFKKYFKLNNYLDYFIRTFINKKFRREGDIHVFPDDHISWFSISELLLDKSVLVYEEDYLLYKYDYKIDIYNKYKYEIHDMRLRMYKITC
jgi:ubiquinone/menaquinone biosynthesis C-methylase UbiE